MNVPVRLGRVSPAVVRLGITIWQLMNRDFGTFRRIFNTVHDEKEEHGRGAGDTNANWWKGATGAWLGIFIPRWCERECNAKIF